MATVKVDLTSDWVEVSEAGSSASDDYLIQNTGYSTQTVALSVGSNKPDNGSPAYWLRSGEFMIRAGVSGKVWARSIRKSGQLVVTS